MHPVLERLSWKDRRQVIDMASGKMQPHLASKEALIATLRILEQHVGDYDRTPRAEYISRVQTAFAKPELVETLRERIANSDAGNGAEGAEGAEGAQPPVQPAQPVSPANASGAVQQLIDAMRALGFGAIDEAAVERIVDARLANAAEQLQHALQSATRRVVVTVAPQGVDRDMGKQHVQFPDLLRACAARDHQGSRLNVLLVGPAGSGKTSACRAVADALGMPFGYNGAIDAEHKLLGFTDAMGRVVNRPFRDIYTGGGVYLFDELDASAPAALLALNAALANGYCDFPDGTAARHHDRVIIAAANTYGLGATADYVGRNRLDAATRDRFITIDWRIDEQLERDTAPDSAWCDYVQRCRAVARQKGFKGIVITPRATYYGCALLEQGFSRSQVAAMTVLAGLSPEQAAMMPKPE